MHDVLVHMSDGGDVLHSDQEGDQEIKDQTRPKINDQTRPGKFSRAEVTSTLSLYLNRFRQYTENLIVTIV